MWLAAVEVRRSHLLRFYRTDMLNTAPTFQVPPVRCPQLLPITGATQARRNVAARATWPARRSPRAMPAAAVTRASAQYRSPPLATLRAPEAPDGEIPIPRVAPPAIRAVRRMTSSWAARRARSFSTVALAAVAALTAKVRNERLARGLELSLNECLTPIPYNFFWMMTLCGYSPNHRRRWWYVYSNELTNQQPR